ncbi:hypothetical protein LX99_02283 [Mucilaginibacter oryzae]|uniref:Uncharacterized protein n=1 Tax=Mucilaginibacter oryzae TaxID=468058 RepID=A0A316HB63_9SPHI|nr:hypothetical protein [Mucilaginibacter oryzae]PWK78439.1 hypothetical protein LX99_02283 [Mucilaginibacter oryzae]
MKILITAAIALLPFALKAQTTEHTPFYSYEKLSFQTGDFLVKDYYIPLDGNINNPKSIMYVAKKPGMNDIFETAVGFKTDSFTVAKGERLVYSVNLFINPSSTFAEVKNLTTGGQQTINLKLDGVISANRAIEITGKEYDRKASVVDGVFSFNRNKYKIVSNKEIQEKLSDVLKGITI